VNDRLSQKVIGVTRHSPSFLLQELGLTDVMVLRPGGLPEKSGVIRLTCLDQDIQNRGRGWIFRPATGKGWARIFFQFNQWSRYQCHWIGFDYTKGEFHFGMTKNTDCMIFLVPVDQLPKARLLPIRGCDII